MFNASLAECPHHEFASVCKALQILPKSPENRPRNPQQQEFVQTLRLRRCTATATTQLLPALNASNSLAKSMSNGRNGKPILAW